VEVSERACPIDGRFLPDSVALNFYQKKAAVAIATAAFFEGLVKTTLVPS